MNSLDRKFINDAADAAYDFVTAAYVKSVASNGKTWFWVTFTPYLVLTTYLILWV